MPRYVMLCYQSNWPWLILNAEHRTRRSRHLPRKCRRGIHGTTGEGCGSWRGACIASVLSCWTCCLTRHIPGTSTPLPRTYPQQRFPNNHRRSAILSERNGRLIDVSSITTRQHPLEEVVNIGVDRGGHFTAGLACRSQCTNSLRSQSSSS